MPEVPDIDFLREPEKLVRYMTADHFAAIFDACDHAVRPVHRMIHCTPAQWWRAILAMAYTTGWRIGEPLALKRDDLDLDAGTAITRAKDNKGKRDAIVSLHPLAIGFLREVIGFGPLVFFWPHPGKTLWEEFRRIQKAAGIHLPCSGEHEHTEACHAYGFHDCRRAFATLNASKVTTMELKAMMRHASIQTTQRYVSMAEQTTSMVDKLFIPEVMRSSKYTNVS